MGSVRTLDHHRSKLKENAHCPHTPQSAEGFLADIETYFEGLVGWTVLRLSERQLKPEAVERIVESLNRRTCETEG